MVSPGKHNNLAKLDIEGERLAWLGSHQIVTPATLKDGIGAYDRGSPCAEYRAGRKGIRLDAHPGAGEIYDDRFLPPREDRIPLK